MLGNGETLDVLRRIEAGQRRLEARLQAPEVEEFELGEPPDAEAALWSAAFALGRLAPEVRPSAAAELVFAAALRLGLSEADAEDVVDRGMQAGMHRRPWRSQWRPDASTN